MFPLTDHADRYALANELHARPFPPVKAPAVAAYLAVKRPADAAKRDRAADLAHLIELLDRFGAPHPQPGASHYYGQIGRHHLKWESHTEFVTYTVFTDGLADRPFDASKFDVFPADWVARAPGVRITSAIIQIQEKPALDTIHEAVADWFVAESVAVSHVLDQAAILIGDFRIDPAGHMRFAVFVAPGTGQRRIGRIVQRICEIETYKTMSMLGFSRARRLHSRLGALDGELSRLVQAMGRKEDAAATLDELLSISAELEELMAQTAFRFGATRAYGAIVDQRIEVLREERFEGRQTWQEFMMRRFDPAMRTVESVERQLRTMAERAKRAGDLLRTRVDVERSAQNQALLESMNQRAHLQLRLQETVEGLSVVAISYYAVSLAGYFAYPLTGFLGVSKGMLTAALTLPVVGLVWLMVRRIRHAIDH